MHKPNAPLTDAVMTQTPEKPSKTHKMRRALIWLGLIDDVGEDERYHEERPYVLTEAPAAQVHEVEVEEPDQAAPTPFDQEKSDALARRIAEVQERGRQEPPHGPQEITELVVKEIAKHLSGGDVAEQIAPRVKGKMAKKPSPKPKKAPVVNPYICGSYKRHLWSEPGWVGLRRPDCKRCGFPNPNFDDEAASEWKRCMPK